MGRRCSVGESDLVDGFTVGLCTGGLSATVVARVPTGRAADGCGAPSGLVEMHWSAAFS
jgi:hypothetical protein